MLHSIKKSYYKERKANKQHECHCCKKEINIGEIYKDYSSRFPVYRRSFVFTNPQDYVFSLEAPFLGSWVDSYTKQEGFRFVTIRTHQKCYFSRQVLLNKLQLSANIFLLNEKNEIIKHDVLLEHQ